MPGRDDLFVQEARDREKRARQLQDDIQWTSQTPDEILTVMNTALGVAAGEGDTSVLQVIKRDGQQLHIALQAGARRSLLRALEQEEERVRGEASNGGPALLG